MEKTKKTFVLRSPDAQHDYHACFTVLNYSGC